jgi:hypothetical protein
MESLSMHDDELRKGKWTKEEDTQLRRAVEELGEKHWTAIALHVPARSPIQCLHRWTKTLRPGLVKGPWNRQEDEEVLAWVQLHGPLDWAGCSELVSGRSAKQCRERWTNTLDPNIKKGDWTDVEDGVIFREYRARGPKWTEIAKLIPGRSENSIKNRFYSTLRKAKPRDSSTSASTPPGSPSPRNSTCEVMLILLRQLQQLENMLGETRKHIACLEESLEAEESDEASTFSLNS